MRTKINDASYLSMIKGKVHVFNRYSASVKAVNRVLRAQFGSRHVTKRV